MYNVSLSTEGVDYDITNLDSFGFLDSFLSFESRSIETFDDSDPEPSEDFQFQLTLLGSGQTNGDFVVTRGQTRIVILDNDSSGRMFALSTDIPTYLSAVTIHLSHIYRRL